MKSRKKLSSLSSMLWIKHMELWISKSTILTVCVQSMQVFHRNVPGVSNHLFTYVVPARRLAPSAIAATYPELQAHCKL